MYCELMSLPALALLTGAVFALVGIVLLSVPATVRRALRAFPRSRPAAIALTALTVVWTVWVTQQQNLGTFENLRKYLWLIGLAVFVTILVYVNELLAPRALGGLFLLLPAVILDIVRFNDSPWRLLLVAIAYALAVVGILLILGPYRFRLWSEKYLATDRHCLRVGGACIAVGIATAVLAIIC